MTTLQFRCQDVGVACKSVTTADSKDELVAKVAEHARKVHGVELTETLRDYAVATVTEKGDRRKARKAKRSAAEPEAASTEPAPLV